MALPIRLGNNRSSANSDNVVRPARWWPTDPIEGFEDIYQRMDQLLRSFGSTVDRTGWSPFPMDIEETDDAYVVEIDLPGVSRHDVTLEVDGRELRVYGEIKERERKGFARRQTRRTGRFQHTATLPGEVDVERIRASLDDGVLMIRAPKAKAGTAHRVQIGSGRLAS
ncbi:Hsp20/alpha crystallin family protein [Kribbella sp. NPDC048915]|uniref:Hsp20/alpha crystallin family protein n=1 Tax=Kribbella sp. NPDC048915 TaxID=3155148 RepID=UPI0033D9A60B